MRTLLRATWIFAIAGAAGAAHALESPDWDVLDETAQHSLEYAKTDEATPWVNPDSGSEGTFTPVATHEGPDGQVCREYSVDAIIDGRQEVVYGTACRRPDGTWVEANAEYSESEPPPADSEVHSGTDWRWIIPHISIAGGYCSSSFCVGGSFGSYYPSWYYPWQARFTYWDYGPWGYYYPYYRSYGYYPVYRSHVVYRYPRDRYYDRHVSYPRHYDRRSSYPRHTYRHDDRGVRSSGSHPKRADPRSRGSDHDRSRVERSIDRRSGGDRYASHRSASRRSGSERHVSYRPASRSSGSERHASYRPASRRSGSERHVSFGSAGRRSGSERHASFGSAGRRSGGERYTHAGRGRSGSQPSGRSSSRH